MSLELPKGWEFLRIGDLCKPASTSVQVRDEEDYDLLGVRWYGNGCHSHSRTKGSELKTRALNRVRASQIVYNKMWVSKGAFAVVPPYLDGAHATAEYPNFEVRLDRLDPDFIEHYMRQDTFKEDAILLCKGSTSRARLNPSDFLDMTIWLPPLHEQRRIAEILSSVDEAIAATQAVIEQTRKVKQGVLERLLTKGIGHTRFKQTEVGEIPEGWQCHKVVDVASVKGGKRMPAGRPFADFKTDHPYIRVSDFREGSIDQSSLVYVLPEDQKLIARYTISSRDVYISIAGTIGVSGMVPADLDGAQLTENAAKISVHSEAHLMPEFLSLLVPSRIVQNQITAVKGIGGGVPKLALFRIEGLLIPVPAREEQEQIVRRSSSINEALVSANSSLSTLLATKSALMSDLLTGRKRVTDPMLLAAE